MDTLTIIKVARFLLGTGCLVYVSRASLAVPRSHGFYRFFAWEAILGLALLNINVWFRDPFSWHQLISWLLLMISALLVIVGVRLLKQMGEPDARRDDVPLVAFEKTTTLVTTGAYRYIRHPLYSSLLFLAWGVFFKAPSWLGGLLVDGDLVLGGNSPGRRGREYPLLWPGLRGVYQTDQDVHPISVLRRHSGQDSDRVRNLDRGHAQRGRGHR
jgi:protein-S-isoprenylcysteine O-methyltransferase Ste14